MEHIGSDVKGYICNSYNTGTVSGGNGKRGGIVGAVKFQGGAAYIYNCYNRGNINSCPDIIGCDDRVGSCVNLHSYGANTTVEELNTQSDIDQGLKDTKLYRSNAWVMKDGHIALDWEK